MALFDPCTEFEFFLGQMTSFEVLLKCHSLTFSKKCLRLCPALSMCLSEKINQIISRNPHRTSKILFVYGSYEFLAMLVGKIGEAPFQSGKITVWLQYNYLLAITQISSLAFCTAYLAVGYIFYVHLTFREKERNNNIEMVNSTKFLLTNLEHLNNFGLPDLFKGK